MRPSSSSVAPGLLSLLLIVASWEAFATESRRRPVVLRGRNLHVHFHTLVLDGVFTRDENGALRFHPAAPPTDADVQRVAQLAVANAPSPLPRATTERETEVPADAVVRPGWC